MATKIKEQTETKSETETGEYQITITLKKREYHRLKSAADFLGLTPEQALQSMVSAKLAKQ